MSRSIKRPREEVSDSEVEKVKNLQEHQFKDMPNAEVFYVPDFIDREKATEWYTSLLGLNSCMYLARKSYNLGKLQDDASYKAYATDKNLKLKYSGHELDMKYEYPPLLREIQDEVEEKLGVTFNHVMLNLYENGQIYIGNHRDNLEERVIASVSLGAPRTFIMTHDPPKGTKAMRPSKKVRPEVDPADSVPTTLKKRWTLGSGSLVVMQGDTQCFWKHEIPKELKVKEGRISLTFRQLVF